MAPKAGSASPARSAEPISSAESEDEATPLSSPPLVSLSLSAKATENAAQLPPLEDATKIPRMAVDADHGEEDDEDDIWVSTARRRGRVAVLEDSDDE